MITERENKLNAGEDRMSQSIKKEPEIRIVKVRLRTSRTI